MKEIEPTIEKAFLKFMTECYDRVDRNSPQWFHMRRSYFAATAWMLSFMASECKRDGGDPVTPIAKELRDFIAVEKARERIEDDILKAGGAECP